MFDMTIGEWLRSVVMVLVLLGVPGLMLTGALRGLLRRRRERRVQHAFIADAIEKITADGKVEGPKGRFKWRRWGGKWVGYANSLPAPNAQRRMPYTRDFPRYPHPGD